MKHAGHHRVAEEPCQDCLVGAGAEKVREDFPALRVMVHGKPLVYLDNAATTQKPQAVIDALTHYYAEENSNVHRGVHFLSQVATQAYEGGRTRVRRFLNAARDHEIVFTRWTTEGINLVAQSYGRKHLQAGDEVIISAMEHHSNIVPWQMVCDERHASLKVIPITDEGELRLDEYERMLTDYTRLVAVVHVSNALGTVNPVREMTRWPIAAASRCWWTARNPPRTCRWTSRRWTATFTRSRVTSCSAPPGSASSTGRDPDPAHNL